MMENELSHLQPVPRFAMQEFKQGSPIIFCIVFGFICCLIGLVFLLIKPWIGALAILLGLLIPILVFYFSTSFVIRTTDEGFSVAESSRRKGNRSSEYRWTDVTKTEYEEIHGRTSNDDSTGPVIYFSAFCGQDRAFRVQRIRGFKNLIAQFNAKTPQLPYTWEPRQGLSIQIGAVSLGKGAYVRVPRLPGSGAS
jgi:hypothetical protein